MRKIPTRKQILDSGWGDFLNFVLRENLSPNDIDEVIVEWKTRLSLLKIIGSIEKDLFSGTVGKSLPKIMSLSRQIASRKRQNKRL